ncbi:MAG: DUF2800 domain-containing protein [Spirochaetales bacterium]|jgi:hypothetical protein|nr:DUF2800 domain-containing protein [Spirochaetales bacterium]
MIALTPHDGHALISPSDMGVTAYCSANIRAQHGLPHTGDDNLEGDALHHIGERVLLTGGDVYDHTDTVDDNGTVLTYDMLARVWIYVNYCQSIRTEYSHVEEYIDVPQVHAECGGTPDFWTYDPSANRITIVDYKDGYVPHSPFQHWQMMCYIAGIIKKYYQAIETNLSVRIVIIQPRAFDGEIIKTWDVMASELRPYINTMHNQAHEALSDAPVECAGRHCRYCKARLTCGSFGTTTAGLTEVIIHTSEPLVVTGDTVGRELHWLNYISDLVKYRKSALEAKAEDIIKQGGQVTGFCIGTGRGKLAWKDSTDGLDDTATMYGVDIYKPPVASRKTPTQVKALLKKAGMPAESLDEFTVYHPGGPKLEVDDNRKLTAVFASGGG